jgi:hypothetical protein
MGQIINRTPAGQNERNPRVGEGHPASMAVCQEKVDAIQEKIEVMGKAIQEKTRDQRGRPFKRYGLMWTLP